MKEREGEEGCRGGGRRGMKGRGEKREGRKEKRDEGEGGEEGGTEGEEGWGREGSLALSLLKVTCKSAEAADQHRSFRGR